MSFLVFAAFSLIFSAVSLIFSRSLSLSLCSERVFNKDHVKGTFAFDDNFYVVRNGLHGY